MRRSPLDTITEYLEHRKQQQPRQLAVASLRGQHDS
jgi:hypothetical protein